MRRTLADGLCWAVLALPVGVAVAARVLADRSWWIHMLGGRLL